jgi:DNA helicase-2/ATP-dependent DNA helicase PcrA
MDFDDLMLHPLTLFRDYPDRLRAYQGRFSFLLVDEFQDTNRAQYDLIRQLGAHGNVAAVGDDDQSIYGWRGADVRNMQEFLQDFPGAKLVRLEENYRSTQVVLDAANGVIAENLGRIGKTLTTRRRGGELVTLVAAADERDEAEWVVRELQKRSAAADWQYSEMAILYRTNSQSRALEEAFRRAGVPYRLVGAISFYDRREVKDLLAYLRLVSNPSDDEAFLRSVGVPRRGLGETSLATLSRAATQWGKSLLDTARIADRVGELRPNVREALRNFAGLIDAAAQRRDLPPAGLLEYVIQAIDYKAVLEAEGPDGADRWENVAELVASAANWSEVVPVDTESGETPLERFLAEAALLSAVDKEEGEARGVTLMTLHTAKGLEWPVVVLTGLEDGLFPSSRAADQPNGVEEERRLCYVGFTRAKDKLYLTFRRRRRAGDRFIDCAPSRFIRAIPSGILEERRTSSVWGPSWGATRKRWNEETKDDEPSQDSPRYVKGERVRHRQFGGGTIQGLVGTGRALKVSVAFDDEEVGVKQLLVAYAGLEREWESA